MAEVKRWWQIGFDGKKIEVDRDGKVVDKSKIFFDASPPSSQPVKLVKLVKDDPKRPAGSDTRWDPRYDRSGLRGPSGERIQG